MIVGSASLRRRIAIGLLVILLIILLVRWARTTVPETADTLPILELFAANSGRSFFPPNKQGCPLDTRLDDNNLSSLCAGFPKDAHPHVHVVLKTGASERTKTQAVLSTILSCSDSATVVSDLEDEIDGHRIVDVLSDLPLSYADNNADWGSYELQKEAAREGSEIYKSEGGWKLDRFKFLPMVERAFATDPDADWYFFTEVDVYFSWDTLYGLLNSLDANERHYVGSAAPGSNHTFFGYGGAGLIMSRRLMHDMLHHKAESLSTKYEQWAKDDCCGDALLAYVVREETGVRVQNGYPVLSGEALAALGVGKDNWCLPLLTLHRVSPELMRELWQWERCRPYDEEPMRLSMVLDFILSPILRNGSTKTHWDNFSSQRVHLLHPAHWSALKCAQHCAVKKNCLQWTYSKGQCRIDDHAKQGAIASEDVVSGWNVQRLEELGYQMNGDSSRVCQPK